MKDAWKIVKNTHRLVDTVLTFEAQLAASYPSDKKYSFSERNNTVLGQYSTEYSKAYHDKMEKMVERQMRAAIFSIGSYWYSAWVDAGQPELKNLIKINLNVEEQKEITDMENKYQKGKVIGREL